VRRGALTGALALAAWAGLAQAQEGGSVTLSPAEMRQAVTLAIGAGQPDVALRLADALIARDASDVPALIYRARALRDLGRLDAADAAARTAWDAAATGTERYGAALVRAQVLSSAGARTRAQIWLRRAVELAPTEADRARAVRDFRYVRARNPWSVELDFKVAPSSNINDGSVHDRIRFAGLDGVVLDGAAQALSGLRIAGGVATRLRFSESARHATDAGLQLYHETYILSDEARDQAPDVQGSDFAFSSVVVDVRHRMRLEGAPGVTELRAALGETWYGGERYSRFAGLSAAQAVRLGERSRLRFTLAGRAYELLPHEGEEDESDTRFARVQWQRALEGGGVVELSYAWRESVSERSSLDYSERWAGVSYTHGAPVWGARATAELDLRLRDYDAFPFSADGREDEEGTAQLHLAFEEVEYYGFVPVVSLFASERRSTLDRYDTREQGLSVGFRSAF
jgi:tetratricopeptide (TPR) repeat protein